MKKDSNPSSEPHSPGQPSWPATRDPQGDHEQLCQFRQAFEDNIKVPCDGFVLSEPVSVLSFDYDGNLRRGLTARCRLVDGAEHVVSACEVVLPARLERAGCLVDYRSWLGLDPHPATPYPRLLRQHKATPADLDLSKDVELIVLSVKEKAARCRLVGSERTITLRARRLWDLVPGEIVTIKPHKQWGYSGHPYLSGEIVATRVDVGALALVPLGLIDMGAFSGPTGRKLAPTRKAFEMEWVIPAVGSAEDEDADAIQDASDLALDGLLGEARTLLMEICQTDLRCLDAHAQLGLMEASSFPELAIRHFEVGVRIGELSFDPGFDGLLPWAFAGNRPFLCCLHGFGLYLWKQGRLQEAEGILEKLLRFDPTDNLDARFLLKEVRSQAPWYLPLGRA